MIKQYDGTPAKEKRNARILSLYEERPRRYSTLEIAERFKITRQRVWKIVKAEKQRSTKRSLDNT